MVTHYWSLIRLKNVIKKSFVCGLPQSPYSLLFLSILHQSVTMSRHNRRRTRGGHKVLIPCQYEAFERPSSADCSESKVSNAKDLRRSDLSAKYWHHRYQAWQPRESKPRKEWGRLKEERNRIFGGDSNDGEDDGLCSKMMEYFVRLDYLSE